MWNTSMSALKNKTTSCALKCFITFNSREIMTYLYFVNITVDIWNGGHASLTFSLDLWLFSTASTCVTGGPKFQQIRNHKLPHMIITQLSSGEKNAEISAEELKEQCDKLLFFTFTAEQLKASWLGLLPTAVGCSPSQDRLGCTASTKTHLG